MPLEKTSHRYEFTLSELLRAVLAPLIPLTVLAVVMHLGARWALLPDPRPVFDVDRTILLHQAWFSGQKHDATTVLIGDSSCLMDISADDLQRALGSGNTMVNLGTLSYLSWSDYALLLERFAKANSGTLKRVILFMHPEALRRTSAVDYHVNLMRAFLERRDYFDPPVTPLMVWSGGEILKGRLISRVLPQTLPGAYGEFYGFNIDLWNYLSAHRGSAIDPRQYDPSKVEGNAEYLLARQLEAASKQFRNVIPEGVEFLVGITPAPAGFVLPNYEQVHNQMLKRWASWLNADRALTQLPAVLSDDQFASVTHLNRAGRTRYTGLLADQLKAGGPQ